MTAARRAFVVSLCAQVLGAPAIAAAQTSAPDYPNRPIRLVVPFAPGAANDLIGRLIAGRLAESLKQPVTVENRAGAGGAVGAGAVAKAAPDGYTLALVNPGPAVLTPLVTQGKTYRIEDLEPVAVICSAPVLLVASMSFAPNTPQEFLQYARANPKAIRFASADAGGVVGVAMLFLLAATQIQVTSVPYSGSAPAMTDISGGHVDVTYATYASALPHLQSGRAKVIGVAGPRRIAAVPAAPTLAEAGIRDADAVIWFGIAAPAGTPRAIVDRLNREINAALTLPEVRQRLAQLDLEPAGTSVEAFRAMITEQAVNAERLIKAGLLKVQ